MKTTSEPTHSARIPHIITLALPLVLGNLAIPLLGIVSTAIVGHLKQNIDLSAVGIGTTVFDFIFWGFAFLRFSTTALVSQAKGAKSQQDIHIVLIQALSLALMIGAMIIVFARPLSALVPFFLHHQHALVASHANAFFHMGIWVAPVEMMTYVIMGFFIGIQQTRYVLYMLFITLISASILDMIFVYHAHMGASGIALGYVISSTIAVIFGFYWLFKKGAFHTFTWNHKALFCTQRLKSLFLLNVDLFVRTFCLLLAFTFFSTQSVVFGTVVLSANILLLNFLNIMGYAIDGFTNITETLIGESLGERNTQHFLTVLRNTAICCASLGIMFFLLYYCLGDQMIMLMTSLPEVIATAHHYLIWVCCLPIVCAWAFWLDGIFMGSAKGRVLRNAMLLSLLIYFITWWLTQPLGNSGLWFTLFLFMTVRLLTLAIPLIRWTHMLIRNLA